MSKTLEFLSALAVLSLTATSAAGRCENLCSHEWMQTASYDQVLSEVILGNAEINIHNGEFGFSPLATAVSTNNRGAVRVILNAGADVNYRYGPDFTAIFESRSKEMIDILVELGANVNARRLNGEAPIHYARNEEVWYALRDVGADIMAITASGISTVMTAPSPDIFRELLETGINPKTPLDNGATALFYNRSSAVIRELIELGIDIEARDNNGNTALHQNSNTNVKRTLLELGANPYAENSDREIPIFNARSAEDVRVFCESYPDTVHYRNEIGETALIKMTRQSLIINIEVIQALIECGSDIDAQDPSGATPLHISASGWQPDLVDLLLDNGANAKIEDNLGRTAFEIANENLMLKGSSTLYRLNDLRFQQ